VTEIPSFRPEDRLVGYVLGRYGEPPYARRGRAAEEAYASLLEHCRRRREELLADVRRLIGRLRALAGDWAALRPLLADEDQVAVLAELVTVLQPPDEPPAPAGARRQRQALRDLADGVARFNTAWGDFLSGLDLTPVNALRDGYNRYYVLEKEIALRSPVLARRGFEPLPPLTVADLAERLPPLPVPRLAG
jgi:hypothetical protein